MTAICNTPYHIYDLTKTSIPYLFPDPQMKTLFQTCVIISFLDPTNVKLP